MERVAVVTDIHANLPALEAVLEAIESTDVDAVYCGGDLVGYGPHPNEVCALIEERAIPTDYAIARDLDDCGCAYRDRHDRELGQRRRSASSTGHGPAMLGVMLALRALLAAARVGRAPGSPCPEQPVPRRPGG